MGKKKAKRDKKKWKEKKVRKEKEKWGKEKELQ